MLGDVINDINKHFNDEERKGYQKEITKATGVRYKIIKWIHKMRKKGIYMLDTSKFQQVAERNPVTAKRKMLPQATQTIRVET